jgi:hypothetical protein
MQQTTIPNNLFSDDCNKTLKVMDLKKTLLIIGMIGAINHVNAQSSAEMLNGAWEAESNNLRSVAIVADGYFSIATFSKNNFESTIGGSFEMRGNQAHATIEFNTADSTMVGRTEMVDVGVASDRITFNGMTWRRVDDGGPGELDGAWLFIGRENNGEITRREPGARKTMKILSGTRFQWIAYNSETGMFAGTGGGTYTTENGKYTENIEFFSRDASRVGASLTFDYDIQDNEWHHKGLNSRGEYMYEVWRARENLFVAR